MDNIVKFPYDACRRVHSRKQRRSKNGTPAERAAKAAAAAGTTTAGSVVEFSSRSGDNPRSASIKVGRPSIAEFFQCLKAKVVQEFAKGKDIEQIFDHLIAEASKLPELVTRP
jgi:hypothetical protein